MRDNNLVLEKILDLANWQEVQDSIATQTKLAVVTVDYKGSPISEHSGCTPFCNLIRNTPHLCQYCHKCDSRGGLEAVRQNRPYIYLCHFGIVDIAIPIIVNNHYVGAIMAGQVRISEENNLEQILSRPRELDESLNDEYLHYYYAIPTLSYSEIENSAEMLYKICNYVIKQALQKNILIDMYERLYEYDKEGKVGIMRDTSSYDNSQNIINDITDERVRKNQSVTNTILRPALEYINSHPTEDIGVDKLAKLCNISRGYFSRLFTRETGESYSDYISKLKIKLAQALLCSDDISITEISDRLGYSDPSYFNRNFKKHVGTTPGAYRNMNSIINK